MHSIHDTPIHVTNTSNETPQTTAVSMEHVNLSECSICMDLCKKHESIETRCNHIFHKKCLKKWESSKCYGFKTCPNCRSHIFEDKIFIKLKADKLNYYLCLRWIFISMMSYNNLTTQERHILRSNNKKYCKMIQQSPGLLEICNTWGIRGNKTNTEFFSEKHRIDLEVMVFNYGV
jgi:hypothetical protein